MFHSTTHNLEFNYDSYADNNNVLDNSTATNGSTVHNSAIYENNESTKFK